MAITLDQLETLDAWSDALDFKIDIHLQLIKTKDPVKRERLTNTWAKAERICNRLAKNICQTN